MRVVPFAIKAAQGDTLEYIWGGGPVSYAAPSQSERKLIRTALCNFIQRDQRLC